MFSISFPSWLVVVLVMNRRKEQKNTHSNNVFLMKINEHDITLLPKYNFLYFIQKNIKNPKNVPSPGFEIKFEKSI